MMIGSITASRIHKMVYNSHDIPDIKKVILQGRAEQKLGQQLDLQSTTTLTQSQIWMRYWSLFLLVIPEQSGLTGHKSSGIDEHECITTPDYQLIDEGQKTTKEGQLKGTYDFLSCECIDQHVERVQHISSGQSMRKGRTGRVTIYNGELIKSTLVVIVQFNEELLP